MTLLRALGDLGQPWTDPVASVLAVMAFTAETLVGHALVVLVLGSMGTLPGSMGRLAARLTSLITPVAARRLLDLLMGSALLAQTALAVPPGAAHEDRWTASYPGATASPPFGGPVGSTAMREPTTTGLGTGWLDWPVDETEPVGARPNPHRSAAPLPPWLGVGPSNAASELRDEAGGTTVALPVVEVGDTLWDIAAAHLVPAERSAANINRYWRQVYRANRSAIGGDPDLLHPGTRLRVPPFRRTR